MFFYENEKRKKDYMRKEKARIEFLNELYRF